MPIVAMPALRPSAVTVFRPAGVSATGGFVVVAARLALAAASVVSPVRLGLRLRELRHDQERDDPCCDAAADAGPADIQRHDPLPVMIRLPAHHRAGERRK